MRILLAGLVTASLLCGPAAFADPWKDESGHGRRGGDYRAYAYDKEYKDEYWDGDCKVERKWGRDGEYKEERKCKYGGYDK